MANPLEDVQRGLQVIRERLRESAGADPVDWVTDRFRQPLPPLPMQELQSELDSLIGLETVKEQVRALIAFLQVQARRLEHGLPEVATSQHLVFLGNPARARRPSPGCSRTCTGRWGCSSAGTWWRSTARGSSASTSG